MFDSSVESDGVDSALGCRSSAALPPPAQKWGNALPVGNGRLGGMVYGGVADEHIQLNEDTIWSDKKRDRINPAALKALPEVRRLLFEGKPREAEALEDKQMMGNPNRQPINPWAT